MHMIFRSCKIPYETLYLSLQVLLASSVDKMIYRDTQWLVDVNDNVVVGLGLTIQQVLANSCTT